ncbi:MAG: T9SS type A sorting domain-containing protein [Calditrichota bacterium]
MNGKLSIVLAVLGTAVLASFTAQADDSRQWSPNDGFPIRQGWHIEWFRGGEARDFGELAGEVGFTWSDTRNGDRGVFLQMIDVNGNFKYGADGLKVADSTGRQEDPGIWPDPTDGGWFVAWEDFDLWTENGQPRGDSLGDIYCTKIDRNGRRVWGNERGVPVCVFAGTQEDVRIVHDGQGGCIIAWKDWRGGDIGDLYAMHINSAGQPDPNWTRNGIPIVVAPGGQDSHTADIDGNGGMIIAWKDGREGGAADIWAQRITPRGELLWGNRQGIQVCNNAANQESPKLCPDGAGGCFITWVDDRNSNETNKDIYAQRINANGQLLWGRAEEGAPLCTEIREQSGNRIIPSESQTALVLWADKRQNGDEYDLYAMRIGGANQMNKLWNPAQGVPVVVAERDQKEARFYPNGQGGAYVVWEDERDGGNPEIDIWAQQLSIDGNPMWQAVGIPICQAPDYQGSPLIRRTADGGCVMVWADHRTGSVHLYAQRVTRNGQIVWAENGVSVAAGISGNATNPIVISHQNNTFTLAWLDGRYGGRGAYPFFQIVRNNDDHPDTLLIMNGQPAIVPDSVSLGGGIIVTAVEDGAGGTILVWEDHRRTLARYAIFAQKISPNGEMLWGDYGVRVAEFPYDQNDSRICIDGAGGVIVAWKAYTNDRVYDVYMQRLNSDGQRMWGQNGIQVSHQAVDEWVQAITQDGAGGAVVVWLAADDATDDDLWATRVNAQGQILWGDGDGIVICNEFLKQRDAAVIHHQSGFIVVWVDGRDDEEGQSQNDIYGQFINYQGNIRWQRNGYIICGFEFHQENPVLASDNLGNVWVVWEDYRYTGTERARDLYMQKLDPTPNERGRPDSLFFTMDGVPLCQAPKDQEVPFILHDDQNGMWFIWEDERDNLWSNIYAQHLQSSGDPYPGWERDGNIVCGAYHHQNVPQIANLIPRGGDGVVTVWEDKRATGKEELSGVLIQRLWDGTLGVPVEGSSTPPTGYALESVYPNPFNSQALVSLMIPRDGLVNLSLFNVNGRMVLDYGDIHWFAGRHLIVLNGDGLANGSYFLRLKAGDIQVERQVTFIK